MQAWPDFIFSAPDTEEIAWPRLFLLSRPRVR